MLEKYKMMPLTNNQTDHHESPSLATKNSFFFSHYVLLIFTITFHAQKFRDIFNFTDFSLRLTRHHYVQNLKSAKNLNTYLVMPP